MKLLQEMTRITEQAIPVISAEELWVSIEDGLHEYISSKIFYVKAIENKTPKVFEIYADTDGKRALIGKFTQTVLDKQYTPVRGKQKPDAEGFILYRDIAEYEAIKYGGSATKVELNDTTAKLNRGDYLVRQTNADDFIYSIETARYFDQNYSKKT